MKDTNLLKPLLLAVFLLACFITVSSMDYAEALTMEAMEKDKKFPAWMVIPYTATVCDSTDSRKKVKCCYYVPSSEYPRTGKNCYATQERK